MQLLHQDATEHCNASEHQKTNLSIEVHLSIRMQLSIRMPLRMKIRLTIKMQMSRKFHLQQLPGPPKATSVVHMHVLQQWCQQRSQHMEPCFTCQQGCTCNSCKARQMHSLPMPYNHHAIEAVSASNLGEHQGLHPQQLQGLMQPLHRDAFERHNANERQSQCN